MGAKISAPVHTGPGAHPASYTMGTGSLLGVKRPGRGVDHTPPSSAEVKERVDLCLCFPTGPSCHVLPFYKPSVIKGREGVTSTPASYLESHGFKSWPWDLLWREVYRGLPQPLNSERNLYLHLRTRMLNTQQILRTQHSSLADSNGKTRLWRNQFPVGHVT